MFVYCCVQVLSFVTFSCSVVVCNRILLCFYVNQLVGSRVSSTGLELFVDVLLENFCLAACLLALNITHCAARAVILFLDDVIVTTC